MEPRETRKERITRVSHEMTARIRRQARGRWSEVRTAQRNAQGRHVWRFRSADGGSERFLHVDHGAMLRGGNPAARLLRQLESGGWLDRLQAPASAVVLSSDGQLAALPAA